MTFRMWESLTGLHELRVGKTGTYVQNPLAPVAPEIPLEEVLPYQALRCKPKVHISAI
jgi:hypothetical protein